VLKLWTLAIGYGASGLLIGLLLPGLVAYSVLFFRREGLHLKTVLRFCGRVLLGFFVYIILLAIVFNLAIWVEGPGNAATEKVGLTSFMSGFMVGFFGAVGGLVIGVRRARRRTAIESP